ncbi:hypothetical protein MML48_2g00000677 [Holotrichia oblita]|uniref:Uncharacterized protein n=1 Tax=Holotrichia oblita TaxID=644536 RepID=A0ACB9TQE8_HOLOL|nr:hypothetical protein MML48_2g00000677 [Holotrichia oblita]
MLRIVRLHGPSRRPQRVYNKRVRSAAEDGAQAVPRQGAYTAAQGQVPVAVPRAARLLRGAVSREGPQPDGAGGARATQVLAEDVQPEGGHVPRRDRGGARRHRTVAVHPHTGAALSTDSEVRLESTFSNRIIYLTRLCAVTVAGRRESAILLEQRVHNVVNGREQSRHNANYVPCAVPYIEGALESNDSSVGLQRAQDVYGDELETVR